MADLEDLKSKLTQDTNYLNNMRKKLRGTEAAYESLRALKGVVERSQMEFDTTNSGKIRNNSDLSKIQQECNCARVYAEGTDDTLNSIGAKVVGKTFEGLKAMITAKLGVYWVQIETCEKIIQTTENTIEGLKQAIREAQQALESLVI